ncbi:MAG: dCTP deaminase, partial [Planctomycetota bacterium]
MDLRLGRTAVRVRAGFLPTTVPIEERIQELGTSTLDLESPEGAVLERGLVYLVQLEESLALPADLGVRFNPRSSAGRCDVFTRVLSSGHPRFDEAPMGYSGPLWLEISPLSFPVRLRRGD